MTFLEEVYNHPMFKEYMKIDPISATKWYQVLCRDYEWQSKNFIKYRDEKRKDIAINGKYTSDFREVAVRPEVVDRWMTVLNNGKEPSKDFIRQYIKNHPEFWLTPDAFIRGK